MDSIKKLPSREILRIFLGLIFLASGTYRIFHFQEALTEFETLAPSYSAIVFTITLCIEIGAAAMLLGNIRPDMAAKGLMIFLAAAFLLTLPRLPEMLPNLSELFFYNTTPTDVFLHITYFVILLSLYLSYRQKSD